MRRSLVPYLLIAAPAAFLLVFFVAPTVFLLSASFLHSDDMVLSSQLTLENYQELLSSSLYVGAIFRSFVVGLSAGTIVVLLAYFLTRTDSRWRSALVALSLAPLLASVIVRTYGWWVILNREGALNGLLLKVGLIDQPLLLVPSTLAIVIGIAHALLPYGVLSIMASLNGVNPNLERAAMSLGANRAQTFLRVTLPLTAPGIAGGFLLTFAIAISAYATPAILGGPGTQVMATLIQTFMIQLLDWSTGSAMGAILLGTSVLLVVLTSALTERRRPA